MHQRVLDLRTIDLHVRQKIASVACCLQHMTTDWRRRSKGAPLGLASWCMQ